MARSRSGVEVWGELLVDEGVDPRADGGVQLRCSQVARRRPGARPSRQGPRRSEGLFLAWMVTLSCNMPGRSRAPWPDPFAVEACR